ncbi:MAG: hypothetical protein WA952_00520 [Lewinella sp.]
MDTEDKLFGYLVDGMGRFEQLAGAISVYTEELDSAGFDFDFLTFDVVSPSVLLLV